MTFFILTQGTINLDVEILTLGMTPTPLSGHISKTDHSIFNNVCKKISPQKMPENSATSRP
jgi:hypothetical protein